ncbi:MAG: hypothetical protein R3F15_07070 [Lysobacterales bacterium]
MPVQAPTPHNVQTRTRILVYGLLAFASMWILFGPSLAASGLELLGCSGRLGICGDRAGALSAWLVPWLSAQPPVDTSFVLIEQCWPLLLIWMGLIVLSLRTKRPRPAAAERAAVPFEQPAPTSAGKLPPVPSRPDHATWIHARQSEQQAELRRHKRTLRQRLQAEGLAVVSLVVACWMLLGGLLVFCLAFGVPLLGGLSAEALLGALDCSNPAQSSDCGFWLERLAPYRQPFVGALLSPVWLFSQFFDLLLIWLGLILLLALLPVYRLGGTILQWAEQRLAARVMFVLFVMSSLGLGYFVFFEVPTYRSANPGDAAPGVGVILGLADALLAVPLLSLIVVTVAVLAAVSIWLIRNPTVRAIPTDQR